MRLPRQDMHRHRFTSAKPQVHREALRPSRFRSSSGVDVGGSAGWFASGLHAGRAILAHLPFFHLGSRAIALPDEKGCGRAWPDGKRPIELGLDGMMNFGWTRAGLVLASIIGGAGAAQ